MSEKEFVVSEEQKESLLAHVKKWCVGRRCREIDGASRSLPGTWSYYMKYGNYCVVCISRVNAVINPHKAEEQQRAKERSEEFQKRIKETFGVTD